MSRWSIVKIKSSAIFPKKLFHARCVGDDSGSADWMRKRRTKTREREEEFEFSGMGRKENGEEVGGGPREADLFPFLFFLFPSPPPSI